ncbi:hypothetical protein B9Q05_12685 [Candidatus Marsarchaeota G2 archaeon ECH_B_1]|uniref:ABC-2 type transporter domain-containing protein n=1 Tax=Candidatus Marsarchaeota G2 archaeon ECH_B_1 TaxID=1978159 RepID=A0A2R6BIT4_9ARCH|nr:MAG: hypothetical protein B9Q05_12685 [Candidatus Marsarchaeota G2 archaeon ECH_B_1]
MSKTLLMFKTFNKRIIRRNSGYLAFLIALIVLLTIYDIHNLHIVKTLPHILGIYIATPMIFGVLYSSMVASVFIEDKSSGLLEFLMASGIDSKWLIDMYIISYLILAIPILTVISTLFSVSMGNPRFLIELESNALGTSLLIISPTLYVSSLQKNAGRYPVSVYIGVAIMFIYLSLSNYKFMNTAPLYVGILLVILSLALTLSLRKRQRPEHLLP